MDQLDLVSEFLLRLPPDEPACLVRASLVRKSWLGILSDPVFIRRYRAFHRTPPLMGLFQNLRFEDENDSIPRFVPAVVPSPLSQPELQFLGTNKTVMDCRHGLVLVRLANGGLVVWDPITRIQHQLPPVPEGPFRQDYFTAAVICARAMCDHFDCRGSPFRVVFAATESTNEDTAIWVSVYSSHNQAWTTSTAGHFGPPITSASDVMGSSLLAGGGLHFNLNRGRRIVRYDLDGDVLSEIDPPPLPLDNIVLMAMEHGGLGAAAMVNYSVHIWSRGDNDAWMIHQVISLDPLITMRMGNPETVQLVIGAAEMSGYLFVTTHNQIYSLDLKSGRLNKISDNGTYLTVFPYECFYTLSL
ncbi:hypothetical protein QOZ80_7BG0584810 [Eleusine coracana subsp. coracana]|nr:hypothetical protein QOZ80_7BG0584810 [Eleusine coracana subsp. coracana]